VSNDVPESTDGSATLQLRDAENAAIVSRRGLLWRAGAAGAAGVAMLTVLDDRRAEAATGNNFVLGQANDAGATTSLAPSASTAPSPLMLLDGSAMGATSTTLIAKGPTGSVAVYAQGFSTNSTTATIGIAVRGTGSGGTGTATGVYGDSTSGTGVVGTSTSGNGVYASSNSGPAVYATSGSGIGVNGNSSSNTGVSGVSGTGAGVTGASTSGVGVRAASTTGNALVVSGKTVFSRSGAGTVGKGSATKVMNISGVTSSSLVVATLQTAATGMYITSVVPAAGKFTVHLNKAAPANLKFAWFIIRG